MSNSKLVDYTRISPNKTKRRKKIKKFVVHHMAGKLTVQQCGAVFASSAREASSNYGVDYNGKIGMYVPEDYRAWCSSDSGIDHEAITIEVSNCATGGNWPVNDKSYWALIELMADCCIRNDIDEINYTGDKSGNLHMHCWYAPTACPGPYLKSKFPDIERDVNKRLKELRGGSKTSSSSSKKSVTTVAKEVLAGKWGNGDTRKAKLKAAGYDYNEVQKAVNQLSKGGSSTATPVKKPSSSRFKKGETYTLQANMKVRTGPGTGYRWKNKSELTADGKKHAQNRKDGKAALVKGTKVTCLEVKNGWVKVPSGWICGVLGKDVYLK